MKKIGYNPETGEWFVGQEWFDCAENAQAYREEAEDTEVERKIWAGCPQPRQEDSP